MKLDFDKLNEFCKWIWETGQGDFLGALMFSLVALVFTYLFWKPLLNAFKRFSSFRQQMTIIPKSLERYKQTIEKETLMILHSWKLEDQSLKEIFVPLNVYYTNEPGKRVSLNEVLSNHFEQKSIDNSYPNRLIVIGDAGSGKSVGMGYVARTIWKVPRRNLLVPILLAFSETKHIQDEKDLETSLVKLLEKNQFENGKKGDRAE